MQFEFADKKLERLYVDKGFSASLAPAIVKGFRKAMQAIDAATDERDLYDRPALRFEKMKRNPPSEHSLRVNDQYRLIVLLLGEAPNKYFRIMEIEDYH